MKIELQKQTNQQAVIKPSGRLDANSGEAFKARLAKAVDSGFIQLAVDMQEVSFIDSSGLSAPVSGFKAVRQKSGMLVLVNVGPQVEVALEMTHLNRIFPIYSDLDSALASF